MLARAGNLAFQSTRVTNTAFGVINKAKQIRAASTGAIAFNVDAHLVREILRTESSPRLFDDDRQAIMIEKERCARRSAGVAGRPLICADVIELEAQKSMEQILHIELVFDIQRRSVFATQPQLASDEVKSLAEFLGDVQVIRLG